MNEKSKANICQCCYRYLLRIILVFHYFLVKLFKRLPHKKHVQQPFKILATGTFYSDHWLITHLRPMAKASNCEHLKMIASTPVPEMHNVCGAYAPSWLSKLFGKVASRLIYFSWVAIKERPDVLVGFHILVNGLFVVILAKLIGAKSVYICGGGPREISRGGIETENRIFNRIGKEDFFIEKLLVEAIKEFDLVVSMGTSAIEFFKERGINSQFEIVPGGFDATIFMPNQEIEKKYDLIFIGRLSEIKRADRLLKAIKLAKEKLPNLNAVIVGDGPSKKELQRLAKKLHIDADIHFVGWQNNVHTWLQKSRCFVLTSDSEGLSQALIQAMMCGLPAITSDVGDLGDLLQNNENGYLVTELSTEEFSNKFVRLLINDEQYKKFSDHALQNTRKFSVENVEVKWSKIFSEFYNSH